MNVFGNPDAKAVDTLRISKKQLQHILYQMDSQVSSTRPANPGDGGKPASKTSRRATRYAYQTELHLVVQVIYPGGSQSYFLVKSRNISKGGIGFLHGAFIHEGTRCMIQLLTIEKEQVQIPGKVVRCRYIGGKVHEIGVQFDHEIDPADFSRRAQEETAPTPDAGE